MNLKAATGCVFYQDETMGFAVQISLRSLSMTFRVSTSSNIEFETYYDVEGSPDRPKQQGEFYTMTDGYIATW